MPSRRDHEIPRFARNLLTVIPDLIGDPESLAFCICSRAIPRSSRGQAYRAWRGRQQRQRHKMAQLHIREETERRWIPDCAGMPCRDQRSLIPTNPYRNLSCRLAACTQGMKREHWRRAWRRAGTGACPYKYDGLSPARRGRPPCRPEWMVLLHQRELGIHFHTNDRRKGLGWQEWSCKAGACYKKGLRSFCHE